MERISEFALRAPKVIFGWGKMSELGREAAALGRRALLVVGQGALERTGRLAQLRALLESAGVEVTLFSGVEAEPGLPTVDRGRQAAQEGGCDVVVAVGGGSVIDVGKAIGALANLPGAAAEYHSGKREVRGPGLPVVAAPTTAGTGAEVTPNSVLTDPKRRVKASLRGETVLPRVALVDPELTVSCPPRVTAFSGLDALVQALESYVSRGANPASDALALQAISLIGGALRRAWEDGADAAARERMAAGSLLAGLALASARLGLVHGLAHPVGCLYHLPHGQVCALLMPAVMRFNLPCAQKKYARAARELGLARAEASDEAAAEELLRWFSALARELGARVSLREFGAKRADLDKIIPLALASGSTKHNPRQPSADDVRAILEEALGEEETN